MDPLVEKGCSLYQTNKSVLKTSLECQISRSKVKKILVTYNLYSTSTIELIASLIKEGKRKKEICDELKISSSLYDESTPYSKCLYNATNRSKQAIRSERFRIMEEVYRANVKKLK